MSRLLQAGFICIFLLLVYYTWKLVLPEAVALLRLVTLLLTPFILAALLSVMIEPLVRSYQRFLRLQRGPAVLLAMFTVVGLLGLLLTAVVVRLVAELSELSAVIPRQVSFYQELGQKWLEKGRIFYGQLPPELAVRWQESLYSVSSMAANIAAQAANSLLQFITALPNTLMILLVTILATYFISRDRERLLLLWLRLLPAPYGLRTLEVGREITAAFFGYIRAQLILITITTIISIIGLGLIGISYAVTIGLLIGFFDLIPVLGPGTVYLPWALLAFVQGHWWLGGQLLLLYLIVMVIRQLLEARVVAAELGLHPLAVLVAMYAGWYTLGVIGLILGPLTVIALNAALKGSGFYQRLR